ncbi:beta-galactosidase-domain-containing protein [Aspergillus californicus]
MLLRPFVASVASVALAACVGATPHPRTSPQTISPSLTRWSSGAHLAVDYYPSQWPEHMWESDISQMRDANISYVRVNEFDWAVLEPSEGKYNFTLLDKTLELLARYNLKAIIGTPTAGPPNWVTEKYDVDFVDYTNTTLLFGSRRGYSTSSFDYRRLSQTITRKLAQRYGNHSTVAGWQLDNEFGCHGTVQSYDHNAIKRFRTWLQTKYGTIDTFNAAQGRVFWSAKYTSFGAIQPPMLEVYTPPPAHRLDWYRFSSDMTIDFAREQTQILRQYAPTHFITTNFMMGFTDFDHFKFAREVGLDLATFDQYPLSGPDSISGLSADEQARYLRTGLPDWQALHHALYRGVAGAAYNATSGPFGIMEMQTGVLNWSPYRVSPLTGMVRLWTHETFADQGDMVCYFRWRQVPYAAEQTLSGLFLSDGSADEGFAEIQDVMDTDLPKLQESLTAHANQQADVALVFDYISSQVWSLDPYSGTWSPQDNRYTDPAIAYMDIVYTFYSALRRLGLSVDIIGPEQPITGYKLVVVPSLPIIPDAFNNALANYTGPVVVGPHTGSKTADFAYAPGLNPSRGPLRERLPMRVTRVETPPDYAGSGVEYNGKTYNISGWEEWVVCERENRNSTATISSTSSHRRGKPAACSRDGLHYLGFNPSVELLVSYIGDVAQEAGITDFLGRAADSGNDLGLTLRFSRRGDLLWGFNYGVEAVEVPSFEGELVIGAGGEIAEADIAVWRLSA